jgi:site-specific recombinase XerD
MDAKSPAPAKRGDRKGKRPGRRPRGVQVVERDGYWHAHGSLRVDGRSVRVRRSLGLAVVAASLDQAEVARDELLDEIKARVTGKVGRGDPVAVAAAAYLRRKRKRPLRPSSIVIVKETTARFGLRRLNDIPAAEWRAWIDGEQGPNGFRPGRMTGRASSTRERHLNGVLAFLAFAKREHGLGSLPSFERDGAARNPNKRARRRVAELRPELIQLLFDSAHITIRAQLAVERCTGARVSSVLFAARICDLILAKGREQITFPQTKNGEDVTAVLDRTAVNILKDYLNWRGRLHDREAPLFLTFRRQPYVDNGRTSGGPNRTGFNAAKRRACTAILEHAATEEARLRRRGQHKAADDVRDRAQADAALLGKVTQHWFRHRLATLLLRKDPRAAMEQGGWLDIRSVIGYAHDTPEYRRRLVTEIDDYAPPRANRG